MPKQPQVQFFKTIAAFALVLAALTSFGQDPQKAKMSPDGRGYLEYLPSGYASSSLKYPAIIFLHGSGERGTGTPSDLEKVKNQGPPKLIKNGDKMCFTVNGKTECFIVLSPQTNDWNWKYDVVPFVKWALTTYRIDPDRVFVAGLSMGGEGVWLTAGLDDNSPNLFAGIAVMAGRGTLEHGINVASRKISVWAFHGDADNALGISGGLLPITGMLNVGANPAPIWTVYPGVGHNGCWERAFRSDHQYHNPNVYEWFLTKRKSGSPSPAPAPPPIVDAGSDKTITLPSSSSTFTASVDGEVTTYTWTKVSGPTATLANTNTKTLAISNAVNGNYTFRVTVKNSANQTDADDVNLVVNSSAPAPTNQPPIVDAGDKKTITLPTNSASFTATASDPDGSIASYSWVKTGGGSVTLSGATTKTLSLSNAGVGTYVFQVTVKDNKGATATDVVNLKVNAGPVSTTNQPPLVEAGEKKIITLPTNSTSYTAVASDPDGSIVSYAWTKIGGGSLTLSGTSTKTLSVSNANAAGTYVFQITVTDNKGATAIDYVNLKVNPGVATNQPPTVSAGDKKYITLPTNSATFKATASDPDGSIVSYLWEKTGGGSVTLSGTTSSTLTVKNAVVGTYVFQVTVTDNKGATATSVVRLAVQAASASNTSIELDPLTFEENGIASAATVNASLADMLERK